MEKRWKNRKKEGMNEGRKEGRKCGAGVVVVRVVVVGGGGGRGEKGSGGSGTSSRRVGEGKCLGVGDCYGRKEAMLGPPLASPLPPSPQGMAVPASLGTARRAAAHAL